VDKEHFNRILRDVEANTLRLQEHGKDVLILERVAKQRGHSAFKYVYVYYFACQNFWKYFKYFVHNNLLIFITP
jgi:hypothetical protein